MLPDWKKKSEITGGRAYAVARARWLQLNIAWMQSLAGVREVKPKSARSDEFEEFVREKRQRMMQAFDELVLRSARGWLRLNIRAYKSSRRVRV